MQVVLRCWKISLRNDVRIKPGEVKESYEDFLYDYKGQSMFISVTREKTSQFCVLLWLKFHLQYCADYSRLMTLMHA